MSRFPMHDVLIIGVLLGVANVVILLPSPHLFLTTLFALPLIFFAPGYALTRALFPTQSRGSVETWVTSVGLSVTTIIVGGLGLNLLPQGLTTFSLTIFLDAVTLGGLLVASYRVAPAAPPSFRWSIHARTMLALGASVLLVIGALLMARESAIRFESGARFTQLWLLPIHSDAGTSFEIGISNFESQPMNYRLEIQVDSQRVYQVTNLALATRETWGAMFSVTSAYTETRALLYRADAPGEIYRAVSVRGKKE